MELKIQSKSKQGVGQYDAAPFGEGVYYRLLKDSVDMFMANQRQGTVKTKIRSEISFSGKKPWKQKHTGRARAGDKKSPIWRKGGTTFGPRPRDYSYHMPSQQRRVALRTALSAKFRDGEVSLFDAAGFDAPSAKSARAVLAAAGALHGNKTSRRVLIVLAAPNENVWKSFRNFPEVNVRTAVELCAYDVLAGGQIWAESAALDALAERVGARAATQAS